MPRRHTIVALIAGLTLTAVVAAAPADAAVTSIPCITALDQFECATITVPQSRSGVVSGTARLQMIKLPAQEGPRLGTLLVLAGGPGQSSTLVLPSVAEMLSGANRYDIIAIDQRGTGFSEPLTCLSLGRATRWDGADATTDKPITTCANDLGAGRATYTTQEAAADIDAVRDELGLSTVTLFGVSYGTKLAMAYAAAYPTRVDGMLLDSMLPVDQPAAFDTESTAAMRRSLQQICANGRCRGFLPTPVSSTKRLVDQLAAEPINDIYMAPGFFPGDEPTTLKVKVTPTTLYETFFAGDFNQFIYTQMPGAIASARRGDNAMLVRMQASAGILKLFREATRKHVAKRTGSRQRASSEFSDALYFATTCEDLAPPWTRGTALGARQPGIDAAAAAIADSAFLPFDRTTVKNNSSATYCRGWPESDPQPTLSPALPDVPALVLNGSLDVRTPTSWARSAVAGMPRAQLVEIPNSGHSVTGTDISGCALSLARRFLIYRTTSGKCKQTTPDVPVQEPAPLTVGSVRPLRGSCRRVKRSRCRGVRKSLTAGYLAVRDAMDQWVIGGMPLGVGLRSGSFSVGSEFLDELFDDEYGFKREDERVNAQGMVERIDLDFYSHVLGVMVDGSLTFPSYPRAGGTLSVYDDSGRRWRMSIRGLLAYDMHDDALTITARSGKRVVTLRTGGSASRARRSAVARPSRLRRSLGFGLTRP